MKFKTNLLTAFLCAVACLGFTQCSGDSSNVINVDVNGADAFVRLDFSVEGTRAEIDPDVVKVVDVYIFDADSKFEKVEHIGDNKNVVSETVVETTSGFKTVYAVAGMHTSLGFTSDPTQDMTLEKFEKLLFDSTSEALNNDNGSLMFGKSKPTQIFKSTNTNIPASNIIPITLVRAMAKATVAALPDDGIEGFGMTFSDPMFCVCQTSDLMPVVANASAISHVKEAGSSTYTNLSQLLDENKKLSFGAAADPAYMAENISTTHVAGTATFVALQLTATPKEVYSYDAEGVLTLATDPGSTFYTVGVETPAMGSVAYALENNINPYCFDSQTSAQNYADKLNKERNLTGELVYKSIEFTDGKVYYRVNFAADDSTYGKHSVLRNKAYKITVNSIARLGFNREDLLFPTNPDTPLEISSAYLNAQFSVAPWEDVNQGVDLE